MNALPQIDPAAIAAAIVAKDALGLAGSSVVNELVQMTAAQQLVHRLKVDRARLTQLYSINSMMVTARDDGEMDRLEADIQTYQDQLRRLISEKLGITPDDIGDVL